MAGARWAALAVVVALVVGVVGCGDSGDDGTDVEKIVLVAPGRDNDPDWTLQARHVVEELPKKLGVRADVVDASQTDDLRGVFEQVAGEGNQLILAHDGRYADVAAGVAAETGVPTLTWGARADDGDGPVAGITVDDAASGYMVGLAATMASYRKKVGVVVADDGSDWDLETWNRMAGGFTAGARSADPDVVVRYIPVGSDGVATEEQAYRATRTMIAEDVQMILGLGGAASIGVLRAIEDYESEEETLFIGATSDHSTSRRLEEGGNPYMLGSLVWHLDGPYRQAIRDVRAGTFGERDYPLTVTNGGIELVGTGRMPNDAAEEAVAAGQQIDAGRLDVPETPTREAVEQLIADGAPQ